MHMRAAACRLRLAWNGCSRGIGFLRWELRAPSPTSSSRIHHLCGQSAAHRILSDGRPGQLSGLRTARMTVFRLVPACAKDRAGKSCHFHPARDRPALGDQIAALGAADRRQTPRVHSSPPPAPRRPSKIGTQGGHRRNHGLDQMAGSL